MNLAHSDFPYQVKSSIFAYPNVFTSGYRTKKHNDDTEKNEKSPFFQNKAIFALIKQTKHSNNILTPGTNLQSGGKFDQAGLQHFQRVLQPNITTTSTTFLFQSLWLGSRQSA